MWFRCPTRYVRVLPRVIQAAMDCSRPVAQLGATHIGSDVESLGVARSALSILEASVSVMAMWCASGCGVGLHMVTYVVRRHVCTLRLHRQQHIRRNPHYLAFSLYLSRTAARSHSLIHYITLLAVFIIIISKRLIPA